MAWVRAPESMLDFSVWFIFTLPHCYSSVGSAMRKKQKCGIEEWMPRVRVHPLPITSLFDSSWLSEAPFGTIVQPIVTNKNAKLKSAQHVPQKRQLGNQMRNNIAVPNAITFHSVYSPANDRSFLTITCWLRAPSHSNKPAVCVRLSKLSYWTKNFAWSYPFDRSGRG